jgi:hypothetical protein
MELAHATAAASARTAPPDRGRRSTSARESRSLLRLPRTCCEPRGLAQLDASSWWVVLRCGECARSREAIVTGADAKRFERDLEPGLRETPDHREARPRANAEEPSGHVEHAHLYGVLRRGALVIRDSCGAMRFTPAWCTKGHAVQRLVRTLQHPADSSQWIGVGLDQDIGIRHGARGNHRPVASTTARLREVSADGRGTRELMSHERPPAFDRGAERRRAAALAHHYRDDEQLSIAEIARRLGRAPATVKGYLYDPTGEKANAVKAAIAATAATAARTPRSRTFARSVGAAGCRSGRSLQTASCRISSCRGRSARWRETGWSPCVARSVTVRARLGRI